MLIFGNMPDGEQRKAAIVLECLAIDDPRSPKGYAQSFGRVASLMTREIGELTAYLERRRRERASPGPVSFRPHP